MKRSYDYSFVSDDITSDPMTHSFAQHTATPATQSSIDPISGSNYSSYFSANFGSGAGTPSPVFRLPALGCGSPVGFNFGFQSNSRLAQPNSPDLSSWNYCGDGADSSSSRLAGLGIRYEGSLYATIPIGAVFSPVLPSAESTSYTDIAASQIADGQHYLTLGDICHIGDSPILGSPARLIYGDDMNLSINPVLINPVLPPAATHGESAYSECPTLDFRAHSPFPPSSLPSLSFCSSEATLSDILRTSPVRNEMTDILEILSSPPKYTIDGSISEEPLVGLIPDINMLELAAKEQGPTVGVNPAEIMGRCEDIKEQDLDSPENHELAVLAYPLSPSPELPSGLSGEVVAKIEFSDELISAIVSVLSTTKQEACDDDVAQVFSPSNLMALKNAQDAYTGESSFSSLAAAPTITAPMSFVDSHSLMLHQPHEVRLADIPQALVPSLKPQPQSPVLNAHQGIALEDLRRRADEYRRSNPGMDLDKSWLQLYAGRLSQRGELIEGYRCYVIGCTQKNKRRDHILVHVGSHVEHRPFQCGLCGMRFLRKNECKRHEGSHAGNKPYSCPICAPFQDKSFVRQDLLQRHMRVTHGVQPARKRVRISADEDYWPW